MKRIVVLFTIIMLLFTTTVWAGILDSIKGLAGGIGIGAIALFLTGILAIGGLVTKSKWMSTILIAVGTGILNLGLMLQDGKVDKAELERTKEDIKKIKEVLKTKP